MTVIKIHQSQTIMICTWIGTIENFNLSEIPWNSVFLIVFFTGGSSTTMRRVIFLKKEGQFWNLAGHFINAKMQKYLLCQISGHHLDCFYKSLHLATFPNIRRLSLCLIEGFSTWCLPQLSLNLNLGNFLDIKLQVPQWLLIVVSVSGQGCISCGILVSGIRARGVRSEHMENMEIFSCSPT